MLINEYLNQSQKNHIIATLLKHYKVKVRVVYKPIKDYAYYVFGKGVLEISNKKGVIKNEKDFLITVLHEIRHAIQATKLGWRNLQQSYELEIAHWQSQHPKDLDGWKKNKREGISFEREAEKFGQKEWKNWYNKFKKDGTI
tara:strand:+ start:241 stop:666 length:426 start_codon:yes stop_codon:yes gene_type:complete